MGRTNVVLDDELVSEGMKLSRAKSIRELIDTSLREYVARQKRLAIKEFMGSGLWEGSLEELRGDVDAKNLS